MGETVPLTALAQCIPKIDFFILGMNYLEVCWKEQLSAAFLISANISRVNSVLRGLGFFVWFWVCLLIFCLVGFRLDMVVCFLFFMCVGFFLHLNHQLVVFQLL